MSFYTGVDGVAREVGLSSSTIKKYYLLLEKHGYKFNRSKQGNLLFSEQDIYLFKSLVEVKNKPGYTLEKAIKEVTTSLSETNEEEESNLSVTDITSMIDMSSDIKLLINVMTDQKEIIEKQSKLISDLVEENKSNRLAIETNVNNRDKLLEEVLNQTKETKTLLMEKSEPKPWWKIWG